jgi:hypothetical protein
MFDALKMMLRRNRLSGFSCAASRLCDPWAARSPSVAFSVTHDVFSKQRLDRCRRGLLLLYLS